MRYAESSTLTLEQPRGAPPRISRRRLGACRCPGTRGPTSAEEPTGGRRLEGRGRARLTGPAAAVLAALLVLLVLPLLAGCGDGAPDPGAGPETAAEGTGTPAPEPRFVDVTEESGIRFTHFNDATEQRLLPETMGSGAAFFDYDRDGDPDLYLVNGAALTGDVDGSPPGSLYQNEGNGTFRHVTTVAGLDRPMVGMGAAVGDVDNDGWLDLLVTGVGEDRLYRNLGSDGDDGIVRFEDVSEAWGMPRGGPGGEGGAGFSSSAAFLDYDRDGWLDLYLARYVDWSPETDVRCSPDGVHRTYCTPEVYRGAPNVLLRNEEGRRFRDVTAATGTAGPAEGPGKSLGVVVLDHDRDGWPDLAVANDTSRNTLYRNRGGEASGGPGTVVTFEEIGVEAGMAYSESGATRGGMGIDAGDVDGDGRLDLVVGNFAQEMSALYRAHEGGLYIDDAAQRGVGLPTVLTLAFGTLLFDADADGDLDLALANGHIEPDIAETRPMHRYAQRPQLFENLGGAGEDGDGAAAATEGDAGRDGGAGTSREPPGSATARPVEGSGPAPGTTLDGPAAADGGGGEAGEPGGDRGPGWFAEVQPAEGDAFRQPLVGRGLAAADVDGDGDLDLVITQNGAEARLLRNTSDPGAWLRVVLVGSRSNRTGYGAVVEVTAGERTWRRTLASGRSYLSASEPVLTFALPGATAVDRVTVTWPSGTVQEVEAPDAGQLLVIEEPAK